MLRCMKGAEFLRGVLVPMATPIAVQGGGRFEIQTERMKENGKQLIQEGVRGLVALGSNGEFGSMTVENKKDVLAAVAEAGRGEEGVGLVAGTGGGPVEETLDLNVLAGELGYDACMVVPPSYYASMVGSWSEYYTTVADASPIPVVLYNIPQLASGVDLVPEVVGRLAEHPNIIGIKDSIGSLTRIQDLVAATPEEFSVVAGSPSIMAPALLSGAVGSIVGLGNYLPGLASKLDAATREAIASGISADSMASLFHLQTQLATVNNGLGRHGIAGVKAAMDITQAGVGGPPLPPMAPPTPQAMDDIAALLSTSGVLP